MAMSFPIAANGFEQFFGTFGSFFIAQARLGDVLPGMVLEDLVKQAVHGAAGGCHQMKGLGTIGVTLNGPFDGLDLARDTFDSFEQLLFRRFGVGHTLPPYPIVEGIVRFGSHNRKSVSITVNRNRLVKAVFVRTTASQNAMKRSSSTTIS